MSWKDCDNVSLRREFVTLDETDDANVVPLCRRFGITRQTDVRFAIRRGEARRYGTSP